MWKWGTKIQSPKFRDIRNGKTTVGFYFFFKGSDLKWLPPTWIGKAEIPKVLDSGEPARRVTKHTQPCPQEPFFSSALVSQVLVLPPVPKVVQPGQPRHFLPTSVGSHALDSAPHHPHLSIRWTRFTPVFDVVVPHRGTHTQMPALASSDAPGGKPP